METQGESERLIEEKIQSKQDKIKEQEEEIETQYN